MSARNWWMMAALMVGIMLSPMNVMFTSVALPTMRDYFGVGVEDAILIGSAYFIPSVALMPFQSQLGNRWGARRIYSLGLAILTAGAFLAALAPSYMVLIVSRVIQGIGWSALYPLALILINRKFPVARQGEMVGIWESSVGLTTIIAPLLGGVLVQFLGWRSMYTLMGVLAAVGLLLTRVAIPKTDLSEMKSRADWLSGLALTLALILTLVSITLTSLPVLLLAGVTWAGWAYYAGRLPAPTIPPQLFRNRRFVMASLAAHIRMLVALAVLLALPLLFEDIHGLAPALVGSIMVIYSIFLFIGSWPGGRWSDRSGASVPGAVGYIAMIAGVLLLLGMGETFVLGLVAVALAVRGLGAGLSQAPYAKAATEAVPASQTQAAAGLYGTLRYSGLAVGSALVGVFLGGRLDVFAEIGAGSFGALVVFEQLWLLLAGILVIGLGATLVMRRSKPVTSPLKVTENG